MSFTSIVPAVNGTAASPATTGSRSLLVLMTIAAVLCGQLAVIPQISDVLGTGAWFDTDDAMRMVQIRNLMGGQAWFDLTEWRMGPPTGMFSHWSRLIDAPIMLLAQAFGLALTPDMAERAARLAWPLILTGLLYAAVMHLVRETLGANRMLHGLLAIFMFVPFELQFQPGRIDHHSAQITLLTAMVAGAVGSLRAPRLAAFSAFAFVLSLAISLENLPFAPVLAAPALLWVVDGDGPARERLAWFSGALGLAAPIALAITVAPARWGLPVVDAMSGAHVGALLIGAAACAALAAASSRLTSARARMSAAAAIGALALAVVVLAFPGLLRGPFADIDPLVRARWLDHVSEVQPIYVTMRNDPLLTIATLTPLLTGFIGAIAAVVRTTSAERRGWIILAVPLGIGVACLFWMVRIAYSAAPLAVPGLVWLGLGVQRWAAARTRHAGSFAGFALFLLATSSPAVSAFGKPFVALGGEALAPKPSASPLTSCYTPSVIASLNSLPTGVILTDIDFGPFILAGTPHSVVAGPYHRNNRGNRLAIEAKDAALPALAAIAREAGADYILMCRSDMDGWTTNADTLVREGAVHGFAPAPVASSALAVFRIVPAAR